MILFSPNLFVLLELSHLSADDIPSLLILYGFVAHHFLPLLLLDVDKLNLLFKEATIEFDALLVVGGPVTLLVDILIKEICLCGHVHILPKLFDTVLL